MGSTVTVRRTARTGQMRVLNVSRGWGRGWERLV